MTKAVVMATADQDLTATEPDADQHAQVTADRRAGSRAALALAVLVVLFLCWRATFGVSLSDDGHLVAIAYRFSLRDQPFVDEMNVQSLGSLLAVPFTWLWTHLFGLSGLGLASRYFYIAVAVACGVLAYRALLTSFRPVPATVAVAAPLLALPYNLPLVSYNTMPVLALVVGASAGLAAVRTGRLLWAVVCGAAAAVGVVSFPQMLPGGLILLHVVAVLAHRGRVLGGLALGGGAVAVPFLAWLLLVPGTELVRATLDFTLAYQEQRVPTGERLALAVAGYLSNLGQLKFLPMWLAALLASLPFLPMRLRAGFVALVPVLAAVPSVKVLFDGEEALAFGKAAGTYAVIVALALLVPVGVWAIQRGSGAVGVLVGIGLPIALLQVPLIAATTSSSAFWGVHAVGSSALLLGLIAGWCCFVAELGAVVEWLAGLSIIASLAVLMALKPFFDPFPWQLTARIDSGAFAGIATRPDVARLVEAITEQSDALVRPGEGVMYYGVPGSYVLSQGRPVTPIIWMTDYGAANQASVEYFQRTGRTPDVVFVNSVWAERAGGWDKLAAKDPLIRYVLDNYHRVYGPPSSLAAFRHS
jgi:hypothetical protein